MPMLMGHREPLVVYGDFGCPMCYLASQRVDELVRAGVAVQWRAIELRPRLPVTGLRRDGEARAAADRALADARALLRKGEHLPAAVPGLAPKTQAAVSAYAEGCGARVPDQIRQLLFTTYWEDGADIGNPGVLLDRLGGTFMRGEATSDPIRDWGFAVTVTAGPITTRAWYLIREWRRQWQELGRPALPAVWDGTRVESGPAALARLADQVDAAPTPHTGRNGAALGAKLASGWRPPTTVHPPATWVSQVGDPWARTMRMSR